MITFCPKCNSKTVIVRTIFKKKYDIRYRKCPNCNYRFKTKEMESSDWNYKTIVNDIKKMLRDVK